MKEAARILIVAVGLIGLLLLIAVACLTLALALQGGMR